MINVYCLTHRMRCRQTTCLRGDMFPRLWGRKKIVTYGNCAGYEEMFPQVLISFNSRGNTGTGGWAPAVHWDCLLLARSWAKEKSWWNNVRQSWNLWNKLMRIKTLVLVLGNSLVKSFFNMTPHWEKLRLLLNLSTAIGLSDPLTPPSLLVGVLLLLLWGIFGWQGVHWNMEKYSHCYCHHHHQQLSFHQK